MEPDHHLVALQVQDAAEGHETPEVSLHLADCAVCRGRVARAVKLERALYAVPRVDPSPDLASQIRAAVAESAAIRRQRQKPVAIGLAAALAALLALALVFQAGIALEVGGALNFFSVYVHQPDILLNYPGDALAALIEVVPLAQMLMTLVVLMIAVLLGIRFRLAIDVAPAQGSRQRA